MPPGMPMPTAEKRSSALFSGRKHCKSLADGDVPAVVRGSGDVMTDVTATATRELFYIRLHKKPHLPPCSFVDSYHTISTRELEC